MLVYQGAAAFEIWFDQPAPVDVMTRTATEAMQARES
jgi:shikimate 5-dehydrogenase